MAEPSGELAHMSRLAQLGERERHWIWKAGMRVLLCIIDIVAIGCAAWLVARSFSNGGENYYNDYDSFPGSAIGSLIVLCVAFVWCLLALTIPFILKPTRPTHPGIAVGLDLVFWLAFIFVALLSTGSIFNIIYYGDGGYIADPNWSNGNYEGSYYLAPNGTWVYNITSVYNSGPGYYNYTAGEWEYPTVNTSTVVRDCSPAFASCAQQDAAINALWHEKPRIEGTTVTLAAVEWLCVLFHFILFVWACVDTHRYNAKNRNNVDKLVADRIINDLEKRGLIQVRDGVVMSAAAGPDTSASSAPASAPLLPPVAVTRENPDAITPVRGAA